MQKQNFKDASNCPLDTVSLSFINFIFSLICFKSLLAFFSYTKLESWVLLALVGLGLSVSWGILKVKSWSFGLYHFFVSLVSIAALGHLYFEPSQSAYFMLLGTISYSAVGSFILHRNHFSACYRPTSFRCTTVPKFLKATIKINQERSPVEVLDISGSGCFFKTDKALCMGEDYHMEISYQDFKLFTKGKIMRECSKSEGYGLMFTGIDRRKYSCPSKAVKALYKRMNQFQAS